MRGLAVAASFAAAAALTLAGCSHDTGDLDAPESAVARYDWDSGIAFDALLTGKLEMQNDCLVVVNAAFPDDAVVAFFPREYASWDGDSEVLTFGGKDYGMGDTIAAGGGGGGDLPKHGVPSACLPIIKRSGVFFYIMDDSIDPNA